MSARRSTSSRAAFGVAYLAVLSLVVGGLLLQSQGAFRKTVDLTTTVRSVGDGLPVGSDVKMRGIIVGRVSQVSPGLESSRISLEIKPEFADQIPASAVTRILPTNLFGAPFVDLRVVSASPTGVRNGMSLAEDTSEETVQMQSVFQKVYDVLVAVEPAKLNTTLAAIADALRGNGERIGQMIVRADQYLSALNANAGVFGRDLRLLAETLESFADASPAILETVDNISATARVLVDTRNELRTLLQAGANAADVSGAFLDENGRRLIRFLDSSAAVATGIGPVSDRIQPSLVALSDVAGRFISILPGNHGTRIAGYISTNVLPQPYTAADCPRYGSFWGPNCSRRSAGKVGGTVGPVGSVEEQRELARLLAPNDPGAVASLGSLLLGPVLRESTVVAR